MSTRSWSFLPFAALVSLAAAACSSGSSTSSSTVSAIGISPDPCAIGRTDSKQLSALATLPDGTKQDITSNAGSTWTTGNSQTATVSSTGNVVGVNAGVTKITVTYQGASGSLDCTIGD